MNVKQLALQVRTKNNRLLERRRALGLSARALADAAGIPRATYSHFENLNYRGHRGHNPWLRNGELSAPARALCTYYNCTGEELFPPELAFVRGGVREIKADVKELALVASQLRGVGALGGWQPPSPEDALAAKELTEQLAPRDVVVLRARLSGDSLHEAGRQMARACGGGIGVSGERMRQLERRARQRLRGSK